MVSLKYEELKACLKKGGNTIETLKLCLEAFSKNDEAFLKAVDDMLFWCPQLFTLAFSECASTRILAVKCVNLFMPKFVDRPKPFSDDWWKQLKQDITKKYAVLLAEKLDAFEDWDILWKLCVSILDIELYQSTTLVNALLKVAEKAFRDKKLVLTAFQCWKHFITVYAKSPNVMFSSKQISLLITPLTAKSHYTLKYCEIKLEVWKTLISLVVDKSKQAVDVIISPLLCFLYGPLKMPVASSFPELVEKSAENYQLVLNNPNVFKYINTSISSYLPKVILSIAKSKKINEELILQIWKTFFAKVKQIQTLSLLDNAVECIASYRNELHEENVVTYTKLIEVFMAEQPTLVFKHLHEWILCDKFLSVKLPNDNHDLEVIIKGYEEDMSQLGLIIGHLFDVPINFQRDDVSKWNTCLSNLSELWLAISDVIHLSLERNQFKSISGILSSDLLLQLLLFPVEFLYNKWCSRIIKHWRILCNDSMSILPVSENVAEFGTRLIDNLILTIEKHPKSLTSVVYAALEVCGTLLSSILFKGNVKQAVPLLTCIMKLIEQVESVPSRHTVLLNEALPKISLWSNLHAELNTDLISILESILAMSVIGTDVTSVKLKNKIAKVSRLIRSNVVQPGAKNVVKEVPSTPKSAIKNTSFMHRLDRATRNRQNSHEDLRKLLTTPEKPKKEEDEYVVIPPKTKVTPLTKHQKEVMKSRKILPAMYNGLSQDTQSQDSQALDIILSVGGMRPVKKTLDSKNENAIDELLDELETKDDSIFFRQPNFVEVKQEPEVNESNEVVTVETAADAKDADKIKENGPETSEQLGNSAEADTQKLEVEDANEVKSDCLENENKVKTCSKILSLLKGECKTSGNNFGTFFNVLINEPHPALYLFHKLKEIAENSGDYDEEFQLICKEFSLTNLEDLFNVLDKTINSHSDSSDTKGAKNEANPKGTSLSRKSLIAENRKSTSGIKKSDNSLESTNHLNSDSRIKNIVNAISDVENSFKTQKSDHVKNSSELTESKKKDTPTSKPSTKITNDEVMSPASRIKRKINPPKRYSPTKKLGNTLTKVSPKLLRSRKSLTLPTKSSPVKTKPRRSLNMKNQSSALEENKKDSNNAAKKSVPTMMEISEENLEKHSDSIQKTVDDCETSEKKSTTLSSEPMDVDKPENVCLRQDSSKELDFLETSLASAKENSSQMLSGEIKVETLSDLPNVEEPPVDDLKCAETAEPSQNQSNEKMTEPCSLNDKEKKSVENEVLNCSTNNLNESRDFTLSLVKTPKPNGNISVLENSPEIFDSVTFNETSEAFSIFSEIQQEGLSTAGEDGSKTDKVKMKKINSALKKKNPRLFQSVLNKGSPLKPNTGGNSPSQREKTFVSLDSWITRSFKQSELGAKPVEFSQNSDIIESSQPDIPLSSFKQNKSVNVASPIMTQFNSSIYCSPKSAVETEPNSGSKPKVARKLILNEKESLGIECNEKSRQGIINNENSYNESSKKIDSDDTLKMSGNFNHKLSESTKVLSPRNQYLGRTALMMNMAIGDESKLLTPSSKAVQKETSVTTPSPPRTPQHLNSVGKKWVKRRYVSDAPPTPSILKKSRNDENESRSKVKLVSFSDPPMIEILEFSASDPQKDTVYGLDVAGLAENTPDDYSTQGSIPEIPEVSNWKLCYPSLGPCRDPINGIIPLLVEPRWHSALKEKLEARNLKTIGCLASLTELQACQIPVGEPRLFRIKNALKEYHRSLQEKRKEMEEQKYERSKFMCKFLMPAGIDKAITKDGESSLKENKKSDLSENTAAEDLKICNETTSVSTNSEKADDIIEEVQSVKDVESRISNKIIETSQTKETNKDNRSTTSLHAPSRMEEVIGLKKEKTERVLNGPEISTTLNEIEKWEEEADVNLMKKESSKKDVTSSEVGEEKVSAASSRLRRNKNEIAVDVIESEKEKQELSIKLNKVEETAHVEKDNNAISMTLSDEENNPCRVLSTDSDLKESIKVIEPEIPAVSVEQKTCSMSLAVISAESSPSKSISKVDKQKSVFDEVENSNILDSNQVKFKEPFVLIEKMEDKPTDACESSELSVAQLDEHKETESFLQSTESDSADQSNCALEIVPTNNVCPSDQNSETKNLPKDAMQIDPESVTEVTDTLEKLDSRETINLAPLTEEKCVSNNKSPFINKQDCESSGSIRTPQTSVSKCVKSNTRSLRKRKATNDCLAPRSSKVLRSSEAKKSDGQEKQKNVRTTEQEEVELPLEEKVSRSSEAKKSDEQEKQKNVRTTEQKEVELPLEEKVLRSSEAKKSDEQEKQKNVRTTEQEEVELSLEGKDSERSKNESLADKISEEAGQKKFVIITLEDGCAPVATPFEIQVPLEHCDEDGTSKSEDTKVESSQSVSDPEKRSMKKALAISEKLEDVLTRNCKSKKELLNIIFRDEDSASCVALLKDAVLNRVDVKRKLFNYLLNDEQLGVKFCVKF